MTDRRPISTVRRPVERLVQGFRIGMIGNDTVHDYLKAGHSLVICCKGCSRMTEWAPPELLERYAARLDMRIANIARRLSCTSAGGCGAPEVAVFPHLYDGPWSFPSGG